LESKQRLVNTNCVALQRPTTPHKVTWHVPVPTKLAYRMIREI